MWVAAERRELESHECIERDPVARERAQRAQARAEALVEQFERLELDWAADEARAAGLCPSTARLLRARELSRTRADRLRLAFCDAVLSGA